MGFFGKHHHSKPVPDKVYNKQLAIQQAENSIRIIQESAQILQETVNPEIFFSQLSLFEEQIETLKQLSAIVPLTVSPDELLETLNKDKQEIIYDLIVRCFNQAEQKKTDKGKKKQYQKLYDSFQPYLQLMDENNLKYLDKKYHSQI